MWRDGHDRFGEARDVAWSAAIYHVESVAHPGAAMQHGSHRAHNDKIDRCAIQQPNEIAKIGAFDGFIARLCFAKLTSEFQNGDHLVESFLGRDLEIFAD